ncbi:MAG: hypothetical protein J6Q68_05495 [Clostridia bacterium]|nr:hypothetical protein [Clostridia bacterium]
MLKENFFEPNRITAENLCELSFEQAISFEKRICEISELCDSMAKSALILSEQGLDIYEILGLLSDNLTVDSSDAPAYALEENVERVKKYLSTISAYDKALISHILTQKMNARALSVSEADFLTEGEGNKNITYVKNRLADEAYDIFSDLISDATVSYTDSFRNAAKAVSEGKSEYCLLPLEEKGGARLATVASILFAYDLKIAMVTPVFGYDGSADVKYALVASHFNIPKYENDDDRYLEIRIKADSQLSISSLFAASELLGASLYRINTVTFNTDDGEESYFTLVFRGEESDFSSLLVFLTLFVREYSAVGIYKNIE